MLILEMGGGLGNQLFCYSLAKYLQSYKRDRIRLDLSFFLHPKRLSHEKFYLGDLLILGFRTTYLGGLLGYSKSLRAISGFKLISEDAFNIENHSGSSIFRGNWQSLKYASVAKLIIEKQILANHHGFGNLREDVVALHIRGNDLRRGGYAGKHNLLPNSYYASAIDFFGRDKNFEVYTDDVDYAKEVLPSGIKLKYRKTGGVYDTVSDFIDLANHRNIVCANSTFSWWAAYLGGDKKVIFPKDDNYLNRNLILPHWKLI